MLKDITLYGILGAIFLIAAISSIVMVSTVYPKFKRERMVYEMYLECVNKENVGKDNCAFILDYKNKEQDLIWK